jgi:hypothetical protein
MESFREIHSQMEYVNDVNLLRDNTNTVKRISEIFLQITREVRM